MQTFITYDKIGIYQNSNILAAKLVSTIIQFNSNVDALYKKLINRQTNS